MPHQLDARRLQIVMLACAECIYQLVLMSAFQISQDEGGFLVIDNEKQKYFPGHMDYGWLNQMSNTG